MFIEQLSDLDELVLQCRSVGAREHIREAILAYKVGAYRISIVATWTAVVYDLIDKIREMAISGSHEAKIWINNYETNQQQFDEGNNASIKHLLDIENCILKSALKQFSFISNNEYIDLKRLKDDRNRCAHPTFQRIESIYYPTAEQSRYHIKNAVKFVLSQLPVQGKYAITNLSKLIESEYFPCSINEVQKLLATSEISRPRESLIKGFIDYLTFGFFDKDHVLYTKSKAVVSIKATINMHGAIAINRLSVNLSKILTQIDDHDFYLIMYFIYIIDDIWNIIPDSSKIKIKEFCSHCDFETFLVIFKPMGKVDDLLLIRKNRTMKLDFHEISNIKNFYDYSECIERSVELFSESKNWTEANNIYNLLISNIIDHISKDQITSILVSPKTKKSDLCGSIGFNAFIDYIISNNIISYDEVKTIFEESGILIQYPLILAKFESDLPF